MFKVIRVAGMLRSGSMWTYNVVRELAQHAGFRVVPEEVLVTDQQSVDYVNREILARRDPGTIFAMKIHAFLQSVAPDNFVITNIRDVRDALLSHMRFMHVDFEKALDMGKVATGVTDHYLELPENKRMVLRYDALTKAPATAVSHIADAIGLSIDDEAAKSIAAQFSKEKVRALTESKDRAMREAARAGRTPAGEILINRVDGVSATFDRITGFQSDHVSDYQDGDWHHLLSEDQISMLDRTFGDWLGRNGFAA